MFVLDVHDNQIIDQTDMPASNLAIKTTKMYIFSESDNGFKSTIIRFKQSPESTECAEYLSFVSVKEWLESCFDLSIMLIGIGILTLDKDSC